MKIFISYATQDLQSFKISDIVQFLEGQKEIEKVWYWDRDSKDFSSIISYMEFGITNCDVFLAISTKASYISAPVNQEIDLAIYSNKKMIPVFVNIKDVRPLLRPKTGVKFKSKDFQGFLTNLLFILTNKQKKVSEISKKKSKYISKKKLYTESKNREFFTTRKNVPSRNRSIKNIDQRTTELSSGDKFQIMRENETAARDTNKIRRRIDQLEKSIETKDLTLEEENKIVDEIDELERKFQELKAQS